MANSDHVRGQSAEITQIRIAWTTTENRFGKEPNWSKYTALVPSRKLLRRNSEQVALYILKRVSFGEADRHLRWAGGVSWPRHYFSPR